MTRDRPIILAEHHMDYHVPIRTSNASVIAYPEESEQKKNNMEDGTRQGTTSTLSMESFNAFTK